MHLLGDAVNVASRVQEMTKATNVAILVSEDTRQRVEEAIALAPSARVQVRGTSRTLQTCVPLRAETASTE